LVFILCKKSLKIAKGQSEAVIQRTDKTMAKQTRDKREIRRCNSKNGQKQYKRAIRSRNSKDGQSNGKTDKGQKGNQKM
jgi:hypothetical protein